MILDVQRDLYHVATSIEDSVALVTRRRISIDNYGAIKEVDKEAIVSYIE
jgi:hypothetical protein